MSPRRSSWLIALGAPLLALAAPAAARPAPTGPAAVAQEIGDRADRDIRAFYAARANRPIWIAANGLPTPAAMMLLEQLRSARLDGLDPGKLKFKAAEKALGRARDGSPGNLARAELALSNSYVRYVRALRAAPRGEMLYEGPALEPVVPTPAAALAALTAAGSLDSHVRTMGWMHPFYAPLRAALAAPGLDPRRAEILAVNLGRLRAIPAIGAGRWVFIDAAGARLWMFDGGRAVDSMKVVVGKRETQTPTMAGFLRQAVINPYWNLPDDLMPSRVAEKVRANGPGFVKRNRFEVLAGWDEDAPVLDPRKVDWTDPAIRVRQLPGAGNFMGAVKFTFPNPQGIYLHDTPERDLLAKPARQFSNGCVRLEDAARFGKWLMGRPLPKSKQPERAIDLPQPVPIYITYLTARPEGGKIVYQNDVYGRDLSARLALAD